MPLFSRYDLLQAEQAGRIQITPAVKPTAFSYDLTVGKIFRRNEQKAEKVRELEMPQEQFLEEICEEVSYQEMLLTPHQFYLCQPEQKIFLSQGLAGEISSRSTWARMGLRVQSKGVDDYLFRYYQDKAGYPLCTLRTTWTSLSLKRGQDIMQLVVNDGPQYCNDEMMQEALQEGDLKIEREGKPCSVEDLTFRDGMILTMGQKIWRYTGGVIDPTHPRKNFRETNLPPEGLFLRAGEFFLSASREEVILPERYVGYVVEREPDLFHLPFSTHANAPYIGPETVFQGAITFENHMLLPGRLTPGMLQSKLHLRPLKTPLHQAEESRYHGQRQATLAVAE